MSLGLRIVRYIVREAQKRGLKQRLQDQAWEEAATFIRANWSRDCEFFEDWWKIREHTIKQAKCPGLYLEFGVFSGKTINFFADILREEYPGKKIYGFDNFKGLTEPWNGFGLPSGFFDRAGSRPKVRDNVDLIVGDIEDTLPAFLASVKEPISFVHIDTDTYTPCRQVLEQIKPLLQCGSVILFDQLLGYLGYQEHELAALDQIFDRREYDFIAFGVAQEKGNLVKAAIICKE